MKYFADLEQLSIELKRNSSNLEQYLCGADPGRSARLNAMIFLFELCHNSLSPPASDADHSAFPQKSLPPDTKRIRDIESLLGSLLIDELSLNRPGTFESIYGFRTLSQGTTPSSITFRVEVFKKISFIFGRVSTGTRYFNSSVEWKELYIGLGHPKHLLALSSRVYLLYLALGELADLKQTIEYFRLLKLQEWTALDSSQMPPGAENAIKPCSLLEYEYAAAVRPTSEDEIFPFCECCK
jgi:hypothetical protein